MTTKDTIPQTPHAILRRLIDYSDHHPACTVFNDAVMRCDCGFTEVFALADNVPAVSPPTASARRMYIAVHALMHEMQVRADNDIYMGQMFRRVVPGPLWDEARDAMTAFWNDDRDQRAALAGDTTT